MRLTSPIQKIVFQVHSCFIFSANMLLMSNNQKFKNKVGIFSYQPFNWSFPTKTIALELHITIFKSIISIILPSSMCIYIICVVMYLMHILQVSSKCYNTILEKGSWVFFIPFFSMDKYLGTGSHIHLICAVEAIHVSLLELCKNKPIL